MAIFFVGTFEYYSYLITLCSAKGRNHHFIKGPWYREMWCKFEIKIRICTISRVLVDDSVGEYVANTNSLQGYS